ncbi:MAG: hypothetical protein QOI99_1275 [Actinomycetota bacterium]|jgi:hypothetical protein|nr:hypothetical protein [Actinomycetota bacterium]
MTTEFGQDGELPTETSEPVPAKSRRRPRPWAIALFSVIVVPLVIALGLTTFGNPVSDPNAAKVIDAKTMEADYGIRVDLVAVTASGGLVDLRFTVIDEQKAKALFHDVATMPALLVESKNAVLRTTKGMNHNLSLLSGGRYFLLFSNAGGVVQAGTPVSVVIDGVRLQPTAAES